MNYKFVTLLCKNNEGIAKLALEAKFDDFCAGPVSAQIDIFD